MTYAPGIRNIQCRSIPSIRYPVGILGMEQQRQGFTGIYLAK